jgi:hypothetical protein
MKRFFTLILLLIALLSTSAEAQEKPVGGLMQQSQTLSPGDPIPNEAINKLFKQCKSYYPRRFTPSALDVYCNCSAAATQGVLKAGEYESLQLERNRKASNPVYQKYVTQVVIPCMDIPTLDIEYFACVLRRTNDSRIENIPKYCQCVSGEVSKYVRKYGSVDALLRTEHYEKDPIEALWNSEGYKETLRNSMDECVLLYLRRPQTYN